MKKEVPAQQTQQQAQNSDQVKKEKPEQATKPGVPNPTKDFREPKWAT